MIYLTPDTWYLISTINECEYPALSTAFTECTADWEYHRPRTIPESSNTLCSSAFGTPGIQSQYVMLILLPGMPGASIFDSNDITNFLKQFQDMCDEYSISVKQRIKKLLRYCEVTIGWYIKSLSTYVKRSWKDLRKELRWDYWHTNFFQQLYTQNFLENFKAMKWSKSDDLWAYTKQFQNISSMLRKDNQLDEYTKPL